MSVIQATTFFNRWHLISVLPFTRILEPDLLRQGPTSIVKAAMIFNKGVRCRPSAAVWPFQTVAGRLSDLWGQRVYKWGIHHRRIW